MLTLGVKHLQIHLQPPANSSPGHRAEQISSIPDGNLIISTRAVQSGWGGEMTAQCLLSADNLNLAMLRKLVRALTRSIGYGSHRV